MVVDNNQLQQSIDVFVKMAKGKLTGRQRCCGLDLRHDTVPKMAEGTRGFFAREGRVFDVAGIRGNVVPGSSKNLQDSPWRGTIQRASSFALKMDDKRKTEAKIWLVVVTHVLSKQAPP